MMQRGAGYRAPRLSGHKKKAPEDRSSGAFFLNLAA